MKKLILFLTATVVLAAAANAQDHGSNSIVLIQSSDLHAGKTIPSDVRFVASGQPDASMLQAVSAAGFTAVVDMRVADEDRGFDEQKRSNDWVWRMCCCQLAVQMTSHSKRR